MASFFDFSKIYHEKPVVYYHEKTQRTEKNTLLYANHLHVEVEMTTLLSGEAIVHIDNCELKMHAGDILVISPFCFHEASVPEPCELEMKCINFRAAMLGLDECLAENIMQKDFPPYMIIRKEDDTNQSILEHLLAICQLLHETSQESFIEIKGRLLILGSIFLRNNRLNNATTEIGYDFFDRVTAIVMNQYANELNSRILSQKMNYSHGYFCRRFRNEFGMTFSEYLNAYRLKMARILLARNENSIAQVAYLTGFSSQSYFTKLFREEFGVHPSSYKKVDYCYRMKKNS